MVRLLVCASVLVCSDVAPAAHALFLQRTLEFGKDSMETQCLPLRRAFLTTRYREFRIVQTPALIMFAFNDGMHREFGLRPTRLLWILGPIARGFRCVVAEVLSGIEVGSLSQTAFSRA